MIDETLLIEQFLSADGIEFKMNFKIESEETIIESLQEFADKLGEGVLNLIKSQPKIGEWIPCSERLPETDENRKYLACGEKGGIYIAEFVCKTINGTPLGMSWWSARGRYCPNPIAWQPLPEPYKE